MKTVCEIGIYLLSVLGMATFTFYLSKMYTKEFRITPKDSMHSAVFTCIASLLFYYSYVYNDKDFLFILSIIIGIILGAIIWVRKR